MVVIYHSIEATGLLLFRSNPMWDHQLVVALSHGLVSALTTSSTLLVVHISFQRFLVVYWPLKYSKLHARRNETYRSSTFRKISQNEENSVASTVKRCLSKINWFELNTIFLGNSTATKPPICHRKKLLSLKTLKPFVFPGNQSPSFCLNQLVFRLCCTGWILFQHKCFLWIWTWVMLCISTRCCLVSTRSDWSPPKSNGKFNCYQILFLHF
jgi:hypothetical protein